MSAFEMNDHYGDTITVDERLSSRVYIGFKVRGVEECGMHLNPKDARKLAKAIKRSAKAYGE